jgi:hypothetical protein
MQERRYPLEEGRPALFTCGSHDQKLVMCVGRITPFINKNDKVKPEGYKNVGILLVI